MMEEFDLDRYLRASKRVDLSGVAWDRIADHPEPDRLLQFGGKRLPGLEIGQGVKLLHLFPER